MKKGTFSAPHSYLVLGILILLLLVSGYTNVCFFRGEDPLGIISVQTDAEASPGNVSQESSARVYFLYSGCGHFTQSIPSSLEHIDFQGDGWKDASFPGWEIYRENNLVIFEQEAASVNNLEAGEFTGFCPQCLQHKYVGIYEDGQGSEKIGVYIGEKLVEKTEVPVKADVRNQLVQGVKFQTIQEKDDIIESFSS